MSALFIDENGKDLVKISPPSRCAIDRALLALFSITCARILSYRGHWKALKVFTAITCLSGCLTRLLIFKSKENPSLSGYEHKQTQTKVTTSAAILISQHIPSHTYHFVLLCASNCFSIGRVTFVWRSSQALFACVSLTGFVFGL